MSYASQPPAVRPSRVQPWPEFGCLYIVQHHEKPGPRGGKYDNPADGWVIVDTTDEDYNTRYLAVRFPVVKFPSVRAAKAAAEKKHPEIKGWKVGRANLYRAQV